MMDYQTALELAAWTYKYKWPESLTSGVMFYFGHKITIESFNEHSIKYRN